MAVAPRFGARVIFNDAAVYSITGTPGGEAYDYMVKSGKEIAADARIIAPKRTGNLARRISSRITRANGTSTRVRIVCSAPYAGYVHNGTGGRGYVYQQSGGYLLYTDPPNRAGATAAGYGHWFGGWIAAVHGQEAQPFIADAFEGWCFENGFNAAAAGLTKGMF